MKCCILSHGEFTAVSVQSEKGILGALIYVSRKQGLCVFMCTRAYADGGDGFPTSIRDEGLLGVLNPPLRVLQTDCG